MKAETEVLFYHLERQSLEQALPQLLELSLQRDWKVVVQAGSEERVKILNDYLWTYNEHAFLPHGSRDSSQADAHEAAQPIWLTAEDETPNDADVLFLVDGADREDVKRFTRCVYMFDGGDAEALHAARENWKRIKEQGLDATYYQQASDGKWEKKA